MTRQRILTYLACPYTHPDPATRAARFSAANAAAASLIRLGYIVYSPISMTHPIDQILAGESSTLGSDFWVSFDEAFMDACDQLAVLQIEGWRESSGVTREISYFESCEKPIGFLSPDLRDLEQFCAEIKKNGSFDQP